MKLSVVVPIYNVEPYLCQCLDSIVQNIFKGCEIILVNDGSTDGSLQICEKYRQQFPDVIRIVNKENGGLSDARNAGTVEAEGKYIYYLDSDDWLASGALEKLYHYAEINNCDVVQGGFYYTFENRFVYDDRWIKDSDLPFILLQKEASHELVKNNYIKNFAWGKLYKESLIRDLKFPRGKFFEDVCWQMQVMSRVKRYGVIPEPLYFYRQRESGISSQFSIRSLDFLTEYEKRLTVIKTHFPNYYNESVVIYHTHATDFYERALKSGNLKLQEVFSKYLTKRCIEYHPKGFSVIGFAKRVLNHFFGHKLKTIKR